MPSELTYDPYFARYGPPKLAENCIVTLYCDNIRYYPHPAGSLPVVWLHGSQLLYLCGCGSSLLTFILILGFLTADNNVAIAVAPGLGAACFGSGKIFSREL